MVAANRFLNQGGYGAALEGVADIIMPIHPLPHKGDKQTAGLGLTAVNHKCSNNRLTAGWLIRG